MRIELRVILEQIPALNKTIAQFKKIIGEKGSRLDGHNGATSVKGIGKITGAILMSVIRDGNNSAGEAAWRVNSASCPEYRT